MAPVLDEAWVGTEGDWLTSASGLRYRFFSYSGAMTHTDGRPGPPHRRRGAGLRRAEAARSGHPRAPAAADLANPGAAAGFGVGGGARALRAGVQPARTLRPRRARPCGVESQRAVAAAARRVLGARGRADGGRRLAAAAVADARVHRTAGGARRSSRRTRGWPTTSSPRSPNSARRPPARSRRIWVPNHAAGRVRGGTAATPSGWPRRCSRPGC